MKRVTTARAIEELTGAVGKMDANVAGMRELAYGLDKRMGEHSQEIVRLTVLLEGVAGDVNALGKDVWGNGKPGLKTDVDRIKWAFAIAVFLFTIGSTALAACNKLPNVPVWTPSAPQQTAIALNGTYVAQATTSARPIDEPTTTAIPTVYGRPTDTPTPTLTPAEHVEVTRPAIIEVGTPLMSTLPPPGVVTFEKGRYTPDAAQNVRACPSLQCERIGAGIRAGIAVDTEAWLNGGGGYLWVCIDAEEDTHGAQSCNKAVLWISPDRKYGKYEVIEE